MVKAILDNIARTEMDYSVQNGLRSQLYWEKWTLPSSPWLLRGTNLQVKTAVQ